MLANACFLELELKTDFEVAAGSGVPRAAIWIFAGADISVELVEDVIQATEYGDVRANLIVGSQVPNPVIGIVSHSWLAGAAVTVHDTSAIEGGCEFVGLIIDTDIQCAFWKLSIQIDVEGIFGTVDVEIRITEAGAPVFIELLVQGNIKSCGICFSHIAIFAGKGIWIGHDPSDLILCMLAENAEGAGQAVAEFMVYAPFKGIAFFWIKIWIAVISGI